MERLENDMFFTRQFMPAMSSEDFNRANKKESTHHLGILRTLSFNDKQVVCIHLSANKIMFNETLFIFIRPPFRLVLNSIMLMQAMFEFNQCLLIRV